MSNCLFKGTASLFVGGPEVSPACPYHNDSMKKKMSVEPWWNGTN